MLDLKLTKLLCRELHSVQLRYHHWSAHHSSVKSKGILCYFESKTAFSWPAAVNHFKHMFTWLLLPAHFQLSPAPTEHNNKHLAHPQRSYWKRAGCMERSGSFENTKHTASLIFCQTTHPLTQQQQAVFIFRCKFYCGS